MGGMKCSVCAHNERGLIDKLIASGAGSYRAIARRFSLSKDSIRRHAESHIVRAVQKRIREQRERTDEQVADVFMTRLDSAHAAASRALERAEQQQDGTRVVAQLVAQIFRGVELLARVDGRLDGASARRGVEIEIRQVIIMPTPKSLSPATSEKPAVDALQSRCRKARTKLYPAARPH